MADLHSGMRLGLHVGVRAHSLGPKVMGCKWGKRLAKHVPGKLGCSSSHHKWALAQLASDNHEVRRLT